MSNRKVFHDSVTELPPQPGQVGRLMVHEAEPSHLEEPLLVHFALEIPADKEKELARRVESGEHISPDELNSKYSLAESDTSPLKKWLADNGYTKISESSDHTGVSATASADTLSKSLNVHFVQVTKDGVSYTAARNAPSLPQEISAKVHAISGLQPFHHLKKHRSLRDSISVTAAEAVAKGSRTTSSPPYLPSALLTAFEATGLSADGSGQTIAILIDTFPNDADLTAFWQTAKVAATLQRVKMINVNGGSLPAPEGEESLDAEWTSGIAPGANIAIYATGALDFASLDNGLQRILNDAKTDASLRIVSISLGLGEHETPAAAMRTQNQIFLRLAALGVNVMVSTGDDGSTPNGVLEVEYPASDPSVVAVGGTTLTLTAAQAISSEKGWSGSGGGKSVRFPRPAWQKGNGITAGTTRLTPDVAAPADPNTGALVILNGKPQQIGGTSWSAPTWAGILALINQVRVNAKKTPLSYLNPSVYPLNGSTSFRDVTSGSNGAYHASKGHDLVTGLGSPRISNLLKALLSLP